MRNYNDEDMFFDCEYEEYEDDNEVYEEVPSNKGLNWKSLLSYLKVIVLAFLFSKFILPMFLVVAYIPSGSMIPTLNIGDEVITINKFWQTLDRGDIIVFKPTKEQTQNEGEGTYFIKRLIGMPGDRIEIRKDKILINGTEIDEPYTNGKFNYNGTFVVPNGRYMVLGDNREISYDGRYWQNPFIKEEQIVSVAKFRLFPLKDIGVIDTHRYK